MVFLAGVYWPMTGQAVNADQLTAMCDVNFTGCARVVGAVLPGMVARGSGHVVITGLAVGLSRAAGRRGLRRQQGRASWRWPKAFMPTCAAPGIRVQLANPGFIRTRLTAKNDFSMPFLMEPDQAAAAMIDPMASGGFKSSFPTVFSWLFRLSQFLPDWAYYRLFAPIASRKP